jgi:outer membrane protein insertion porin family
LKRINKKFIVLFFFYICLLPGYLFPTPVEIKEIDITGNKNVETNNILKTLGIKKGDEYSEEVVRNGLKKIYELGFFENVTIEVFEVQGGVDVTYVVTEKPLVKSIEFRGNKKFSNGKLKKEIQSKEKEPFDNRKMQEDVEKIATLYTEKGYVDVKVEPSTTKDEKSGMVIETFSITEGKQIRIGKVNLIGVEAFDTKKINKIMKTKRKKIFIQQSLDKDLKIIEAYYKERGFLKVHLGTPIVIYNEERTGVFVTLFVYEGLKYTVGDIQFQGNYAFTTEELKADLEVKQGEIFNQVKLDNSLSNIQERYGEKGYIQMRTNPEYFTDDEKKVVNISISINEDGIVYIDRISIGGNVKTKDYVIKREFLVKEGDPFNVKKIKRTQEKLYNLGFFSDVAIRIGETNNPYTADLICQVTEQGGGVLTLGAGYNTQTGILGTFEVKQNNLFGRGQNLSLMIQAGRQTTKEATFTEPWFLGKPITFGIDIYQTTTLLSYYTYYQETKTGGDIRMGRRLTDTLGLTFIYDYEWVRIFNAAPSLLREEGRKINSSLATCLTRDTRDYILDPSRGSLNSISFQVFGGILGGDTNMVMSSVSSSWFFPTFDHFVLSLQLRYGIASYFSPSTEVPIYERFYLGGANTVRGYNQNGIGLRNGAGGVTYFISNVEYKFPIVMAKGHSLLQGVIFLDTGGDWDKQRDVNFTPGPGDNQLKIGIGAGIRFKTPIFPIRLDWGYGLNHIPGEPKSQFYFIIGQ